MDLPLLAFREADYWTQPRLSKPAHLSWAGNLHFPWGFLMLLSESEPSSPAGISPELILEPY